MKFQCDGTQPLVLLPAVTFRVPPVRSHCKQNTDSKSSAGQNASIESSGVRI